MLILLHAIHIREFLYIVDLVLALYNNKENVYTLLLRRRGMSDKQKAQ